MAKPRLFSTIPVAALRDARLSALDLRCLAAIALRDGMSGVKGAGGGCYAKLETLAADVGVDITSFSRTLSRLVKWGYVTKEAQAHDRRKSTLRVNYPGPEIVGETVNLSRREIVDQSDNYRPELIDEPDNQSAEIVDNGESENGGFLRVSGGHYSSLREELDFVETKELNSDESAHSQASASCEQVEDELVDQAQLRLMLDDAIASIGSARALARKIGVSETAVSCVRNGRRVGEENARAIEAGLVIILWEAECASRKATRAQGNVIPLFAKAERQDADDRGQSDQDDTGLFERLPERFFDLDSAAQVPIIERTLKEIGHDRLFALNPRERVEIEGLLSGIADAFYGEALGHQAQRVLDTLP